VSELISTLKERFGGLVSVFDKVSLIDDGVIQLGDRTSWLRNDVPEDLVVVAVVSASALLDRSLRTEWQTFSERGIRLIPAYLLESFSLPVPPFLEDHEGVDLIVPGGLQRLVEGLGRLVAKEPLAGAEREFPVAERLSATPLAASLLVRRISLTNIRCFESFDLNLADDDAKPALLTMVLGDNAAGKSTLLRSIALGLSSESDASALIKQLPGPFVRRGAEEGTIRLELSDPANGRELAIITRILNGGTPDEKVRKETEPEPFPWDDVFVCAYGTNRSRQAAASYEEYTLHQAVLSLFDDDTVLQNPEVILLRLEPALRTEIEHRMLRILMLEGSDYEVSVPRSGLEIRGPWGSQPLRSLSDGYRSTAQWVLDFLGWAIYDGRLENGGDIGGILLVDELEQHLHPRWQRHIVQRLRKQFPKTQIFASTHTPLAAVGTADVESARLLRLRTEPDGKITTLELDPQSLDGLRADQVLASDAFGLYTSRNPGSEDDMTRYAELLGKAERKPEENAEMERLGASLEATLRTGETEVEREVEQAVETALKERVAAVKPELLDLEVRRQLHELFAGDEKD
jgi:energy-coupling factor transporter ATP-binding protein EcfA2